MGKVETRSRYEGGGRTELGRLPRGALVVLPETRQWWRRSRASFAVGVLVGLVWWGRKGHTEGLFKVDFDVFEECKGDWEDEAVFRGRRHRCGVLSCEHRWGEPY